MRELKVHKIGDLCFDFKMGKDVGIDFYLKSEADKVIAEKDKEIAKLKSKLDLYKRGFAEDDKINAYLYAELRRQKHKRCLTNALWCLREEFFAEDCHCERWVDWAIKWYKRWLEIAEKFK